MKNRALHLTAILILVAFCQSAAWSQSGAGSEWTTWGYDQARTGWNKAETTLTKENVSKLELKWAAQLNTPSDYVVLSTLTAPLVANIATPQGARTYVIVVGSDNSIYAINADTGKISWQRS